MYYSWNQFRLLEINKGLSIQTIWIRYNDLINESLVNSAAIAAASSSSGRGNRKSGPVFFDVDTSNSFSVNLNFSNVLTVNWGDGTTSLGSSLSHLYSNPGQYEIVVVDGHDGSLQINDFLSVSGIKNFRRLGSMKDLNIFEINSSFITGLTRSMFSGVSIGDLTINECDLLSQIDSDTFVGQSSLTQLQVQFCDILTDISNLNLSTLSNLQSINFNNCALGIGLNIGDCFKNLPALTNLSLEFNFISTITGATFIGLPNLDTLSLNYNFNLNIGDSIKNLPLLTELQLHSSQITSISAATFTGLPSLSLVALYDNLITGFNNLKNIPNLQTLYIAANNIPFSAITGITSLTFLDMQSNSLSAVTNIENLSNLQFVFLAFNHITTLPTTIANLTQLRYLELSFNQIIAIPEAVTGITSLQILHLHNNLITDIDDTIKNMPNLFWLTVSDNFITTLSGMSFSGLTTLLYVNGILDVSNNNISDTEMDALLIKLDSLGAANLQIIGFGNNGRTTTSDIAVSNLMGRNCTITL